MAKLAVITILISHAMSVQSFSKPGLGISRALTITSMNKKASEGLSFPNPFAIFKPRKKEESGLDRVIDDAFKNAGPLGKVAGGLIKGVASTIASSMEELRTDVDLVSEQTERVLMLDREASEALGSSIRCGAPFSQMSSSSSFNGVSAKQISLQMPVTGDRAQGTVAVQAQSQQGGEVDIRSIDLNVNGKQFSVGAGKQNGDLQGENLVDSDVIDIEIG